MYRCCVHIPVSPAMGRLPHQFQPDRAYRGMWKGNPHPVLLLQKNTGHLSFYWRKWRHPHRSGTVPHARLVNYVPVHCSRSKVNRKGNLQITLTGRYYLLCIVSASLITFKRNMLNKMPITCQSHVFVLIVCIYIYKTSLPKLFHNYLKYTYLFIHWKLGFYICTFSKIW